MEIIKPAFHHVTFKTSRLAEMVAWYGTVVGARPNFQDANNAWTTNDEANHRVAFLSAPGLGDDPDKRSHNGMHHSAFEYESFTDLMSSYARLRDEGIQPAFSLDHGMTISIYYRDPEGNFVEPSPTPMAIGSGRANGCAPRRISRRTRSAPSSIRSGSTRITRRARASTTCTLRCAGAITSLPARPISDCRRDGRRADCGIGARSAGSPCH